MVAWYWAFLLSGRVEDTMPPTLSMEHERRPAEMSIASSVSRYTGETPNVAAIDSRETER